VADAIVLRNVRQPEGCNRKPANPLEQNQRIGIAYLAPWRHHPGCQRGAV
jgi:hypothetical protein